MAIVKKRHLVVGPAKKLSTRSMLLYAAPLLKEKWHFRCSALTKHLLYPGALHNPGFVPRLSPYDCPVDSLQWKVVDWP